MGRSWLIAIELEVPNKRSWLGSIADASAFDDWPELFESRGKPKPKVSALLDRFRKEGLSSVEWRDETLRASAILSHDGSFWVDCVTHLAAAVRISHGEGELVVANAGDNTEEIVVVVSAERGVRVAKGKERSALQKRLSKIEDELGSAVLADADRRRRAEPFVRDERLRPVHAKILRALHDADPQKLLRAAGKVEGTLSLLPKPGAKTHASFAKLYDSAPALLRALTNGDERVHAWCAGQYLAASLEILDRVAPEVAAVLAREALAAKGKHPSTQAFRDVATGIDSRAAGDDVGAALQRLRKEMPAAHVLEQDRIRRHPIVARVAKLKSETARAAILAALERVVGAPSAWKKLSEKDASFGYALTHVLEAQKNSKDEMLLRALWKHPHWMLANPMKAGVRR